ncbi:MAG: hypothetical protein LBB82_06945, partial [Treponema sp.]|nr:hypothetical protein [Treponema sp.]
MRKSIKPLFTALALLFAFLACSQEPLFYYIAMEVEPIKPAIGGSVSRFARTDIGSGHQLYVANGSLWVFDTTGTTIPVWASFFPQPGGKIKSVAATANNELFTIDYDGVVKHWNDGSSIWESVSGSPAGAQQIFGAGNYLFIGSAERIFACDSASISTSMTNLGPAGLLLGAVNVGTTWYLATKTGIYEIAGPPTSNPLSSSP